MPRGKLTAPVSLLTMIESEQHAMANQNVKRASCVGCGMCTPGLPARRA